MILQKYKTKYCPECQSLVFNYENVGDVCNCKDGWQFKSEYPGNEVDPDRLKWIEVMVKIDDKLS